MLASMPTLDMAAGLMISFSMIKDKVAKLV